MKNNNLSPESPKNIKESIFTGEDFSIRDYKTHSPVAECNIYCSGCTNI